MMKSIPWFAALCLLYPLAAAGMMAVLAGEVLAQPPAAEWKIGLAQVKITPEQPIFMSGYASRTKPFERVEADLWAKALYLEDGRGGRAVVITTDLLGFPASIADPMCERIREKTGLRREQVLINSAHIHSGPMIGADDAARDNVPADEARKVAEYTRKLVDKIVDLAAQSVSRPEPARLSMAGGVVDFPMNRRQWTPNGVVLGANPRGFADRSVPVLRVEGADGKVKAALFGAGVHNTTLRGNSYEICGDYAGFAQAFVQEQLPGVQAMFMLGCAGDADPYPHGTMALAKAHGLTLGKEVCRVLAGKTEPVRGPLRVAFERVELPLQKPPAREELEKQAAGRGTTAWVAKQMLERLNAGQKLPEHYATPLAVWQFGEDLTLVALSGEVVSDYIPLIEKAVGPLRLWVTAYNNDVYGYLPSSRVISEGGYECRGLYAGGIGYFATAAQDVQVNQVRELARKVGRKVPE